MRVSTENLYQASEFAKKARVSVRTLHHYDRIGLLRPRRYTGQGFRLYGEKEFARLQQILTLKFLGFSLKQIKEVLGREELDLSQTLQMQRRVIETQSNRLQQALKAIHQAEKVLQESNSIDWESFQKIIEVIDMEQNMDWAKKYYSEEAQAKIDERKKLWSPELQEQVTKDWNEVIQGVKDAIANGVSPKSEQGQKLAARWRELIHGFTGGDPEIQAGLNQMYADSENWQSSFKKPFGDDVQNFITEALT